MGDRRCCCAQGCEIMEDDFARSDSSALGSLWTEISGDWEIVSQQLVETSSTPEAIVITTDRNHYNSKRGVVDLTVIPSGSGPWQFKILVNSDDGALDYQYVDFSFSAGGLTITAGNQSRSWITGTQPGDCPSYWEWPDNITSKYIRARVCLTEGLLYGQVTVKANAEQETPDFVGVVWDNAITLLSAGDGYAGLRWDAGDLAFDDFIYQAHYDDDVDCPLCVCRCSAGHYPPWKIRVDFTNDDGNCPCYDGGYGIFEYDGALPGMGSSGWVCVEGEVCSVDLSCGTGIGASIDCGQVDPAEPLNQTDWDLRIIPCTDDVQSTSINCEAASFEIRWDIELAADVCTEYCTDDGTVVALGTDGTLET